MKQITEETYEWLMVKFPDEIKMPENVDLEVINQKSRAYKFWCWATYGHLYREGVCLRCGKKHKGVLLNFDDLLKK